MSSKLYSIICGMIQILISIMKIVSCFNDQNQCLKDTGLSGGLENGTLHFEAWMGPVPVVN